ncbi:MAG: 1-acyl-sn-glycerol-3-phosphate acyltransferase [Thalassovita sp.]
MPSEPEFKPIGVWGWLRVLLRGPVFAIVVFGSLLVNLPLRAVERLFFGMHRPITPYITQFAARQALRVLGLGFVVHGERMKERGAVVANHCSWLDIFTMNAGKRIYFVSKSEVAGWPGIGTLAKSTGTVFINRTRKDAKIQQTQFEERLLAGHKLLFFPEGTSTDGMVVLPFKSTLFQAFFSEELRHEMHIQPVTMVYWGPKNGDPRFYGWWGGMDFGAHMLRVLAAPKQGRVEVTYHPPVRVDDFANRKSLASHVEATVRSAMPLDRQKNGLTSPTQK